jgi:PAS domain S-box-containing protein
MITVGADGRISMANSETERLFGYDRRELIGQPIEILLPERLRQVHVGHRGDFHRQPRRRPMGVGLDLVARRRDGSEFPTEISLSPLDMEEGLSVIVVVRDITERRKAEEARAALAREQAARIEAEMANRAKDEFLAVVSHELRTPLNAILGWAVLLQAEHSEEAVRARALQAIERNARMQRQVIDDLLDVSAITAGKVRLDVQEVNLATVLGAAEESVRPAAESVGISLQVELDPNLPLVLGDARRLQQVFWNVLSNAVKFTPAGGHVRASAAVAGPVVDITVADNGVGIDRTFLPHVFDRFRQLDSSPARSHGGLGLGLAIVRELVELHGGTVKALSEGEGRGSTFTVSLPVPAMLHHRHTTGIGHAKPGGGAGAWRRGILQNLRALVVDDDEETLTIVGAILRDAGMSVTTACGAGEALTQLERLVPDVLISDIGMPGLDGYRLIAAVRERGLTVPAIALTGYGRQQDRDRALSAGFQAHLAKPVLPADLLSVIEETRDGRLR